MEISFHTWMFVIAFDIWKTIRSKVFFTIKSYTKYSIFAWSLSLIFTIFVTLIDLIELNPKIGQWIKPKFGKSENHERNIGTLCFMSNLSAHFYFLTIPIAIELVLKIILFVSTIWSILWVKNNITEMRGSAMRRHYITR
jgi:hypothetical protein